MLDKIGNFNSEPDGAQDYDLFLRLTEQTDKIVHVPKCLYYWRASPSSTASSIQSKTYAIEAGKRALENHFKRCNNNAYVDIYRNILYKANYSIYPKSKVSIIIINDNTKCLKNCIDSIKQKTNYENYEIITEDAAECLPVIYNSAAKKATGKYLIFLNCNTIIDSENWIDELLMHAQKPENGAVGAKFYNGHNKVSHFGYILGIKKISGTINKGLDRTENGYVFRLSTTQNVCAVSSDCMMIAKKKFEEINGFDETYKDSFFDIDFCLKLREKGYENLCTPHVELYYVGKKRKANKNDSKIIYEKLNKGFDFIDPYYNINFTRKTEDFRVTGEIFPKE